MSHKVVVYGTLKKGKGNHRVMGDARKIGEGFFPGTMFSLSGFPAVTLEEPGEQKFFGEIYDCSDEVLANCDRLEGIAYDFYQRSTIKTEYGDAFVYTMPRSKLTDVKAVPSGVW